jgi:hypothetical protein
MHPGEANINPSLPSHSSQAPSFLNSAALLLPAAAARGQHSTSGELEKAAAATHSGTDQSTAAELEHATQPPQPCGPAPLSALTTEEQHVDAPAEEEAGCPCGALVVPAASDAPVAVAGSTPSEQPAPAARQRGSGNNGAVANAQMASAAVSLIPQESRHCLEPGSHHPVMQCSPSTPVQMPSLQASTVDSSEATVHVALGDYSRDGMHAERLSQTSIFGAFMSMMGGRKTPQDCGAEDSHTVSSCALSTPALPGAMSASEVENTVEAAAGLAAPSPAVRAASPLSFDHSGGIGASPCESDNVGTFAASALCTADSVHRFGRPEAQVHIEGTQNLLLPVQQLHRASATSLHLARPPFDQVGADLADAQAMINKHVLLRSAKLDTVENQTTIEERVVPVLHAAAALPTIAMASPVTTEVPAASDHVVGGHKDQVENSAQGAFPCPPVVVDLTGAEAEQISDCCAAVPAAAAVFVAAEAGVTEARSKGVDDVRQQVARTPGARGPTHPVGTSNLVGEVACDVDSAAAPNLDTQFEQDCGNSQVVQLGPSGEFRTLSSADPGHVHGFGVEDQDEAAPIVMCVLSIYSLHDVGCVCQET